MSPGGRSEVLGLGFITPQMPVAVLGSGLAISIDPKTRKKKDTLAQHEDRLTNMCISGAPESRRLVTASHDGWVRVTELSRPAGSLPGPLQIKEVRRFVASPGW